jgi:competence protein ComEA
VDPLPGRPLPARPIAEIVRAWLQWFGLIRLVVIAVAVCAVGAGAYWLLRAPATPIENTLPMASRTTTTTISTVASAVSVDAATSTTLVAGASPAADAVVVVDVAGAVVARGVYELAAGARTHDAIEIAGTVEQLDVLPGVGPATAAAIVAYREQVGPFAAVDDLLKVPGIGPAKLDALRDLVVV